MYESKADKIIEEGIAEQQQLKNSLASENNLSGLFTEDWNTMQRQSTYAEEKIKQNKEEIQSENLTNPGQVYDYNTTQFLNFIMSKDETVKEYSEYLNYDNERRKIESISEGDPNERYKELKKLVHDRAYEDSSEKGIIDFAKSHVAKMLNSEEVSTDEALKEARDRGVELKFDKPISRGELEYAIQKEVHKKELDKQIAIYRQNGDYTTLQNILLMGSAISGGVGALEMAAIIGTSIVTGQLIAGGLALGARLAGAGSTLYKSVQLARKIAIMEKLAIKYRNTEKAAKIATKLQGMQTTLKEADFATKAVYDTFRAGKMIQGTRGSVANTSAYFAADGLITDLPVALARYAGSESTYNEEYGTKQLLAELVTSTMIGAGSAVVGAGIKKIPNALYDLKEAALSKLSKNTSETVSEAVLKAREGFAEEVEKNSQNIENALNDVFNIAASNLSADEKAAATYKAIAYANLSEEESQLLLFTLIDAIKNGKSLDIINELPFRNRYYSNVLGMLDTMKFMGKNGEGTHVDFINLIKEAGLNLSYTTEVNKELSPLQEVLLYLNKGTGTVGAKIAEEGGALGRTFAHGLCSEDAEKFLFNTYLSRMADDTDRGIQAGLEAEKAIANMEQIKQKLDRIIDTYEMIAKANDEAKKLGRLPVYPYNHGGQNKYILNNGEQGSLRQALEELAISFMPVEKQEAYKEALSFLDNMQANEALLGRAKSDADQLNMFVEAQKIHKQTIDEVNQYVQDFIDTLAFEELNKKTGDVYFNLRNIGTKEKDIVEDVDFLKQLSDNLNTTIEENSNLYNSDKIFQQGIKDPEELLAKIQGKEDIPALGFSYGENSTTALDMREILKSENAAFERYQAANFEVNKYKSEASAVTLQKVMSIMEEQANKEQTLNKGYLLNLTDNIKKCNAIINGDYTTFRDNLIHALQDKELFKDLLSMEGLSDLSSAALSVVIKEEEEIFRTTIKDTLFKTLGIDELRGVFGDRVNEAIEDATDSFMQVLKNTKEGGLDAIAGKHSFNIQQDTVEQITDAMKKDKLQKEIFSILLEPFVKELAISVADCGSMLLHTQARTYAVWDKCMKNPGKMSELILGDVTMTYMPTFGASESIENLKSINTEYSRFLQSIDKLDSHEAGVESLREWAFNANNQEAIANAIVDRWAMLNGLMTEEERLAFKENTREGRVAMAYLDSLADMQGRLYNIGSGKKDLVSFLNNTLLANAESYCKANSLRGPLARNISNLLDMSDVSTKAKEALASFLPASQDKADIARSRAALNWLEQLDLDKQFRYRGKLKLNTLRDALLAQRTPGHLSAWQELINKYGKDKVDDTLRILKNNFFGEDSGKGKLSIGLMDKFKQGSKQPSAELASYSSKYLNDLDMKLHYKSLDALKADMKYFGYDDIEKWFAADMGTAKNAYAVLAKAGPEPFQFYENLKHMARTYADHIAPLEHGLENAKLLQESVKSSTWETSLHFAVNQVCGTYSQPVSVGARIVKCITRFLSAPMLMKAGLKSLTDNGYSYQYLVTMGLMSGSSITDRGNILQRAARRFTSDRFLGQYAYLTQGLKTDLLQEALFNTAGMTNTAAKGLNKEASTLLKAESAARKYSDFMLNKIAWIGPLTEYNRITAALCLGQSLGEFATTRFAQMEKKLQQSLGRFGITAEEWDEIFSKKAVMNMNDYIKRTQPNIERNPLHDFQFFAPDLLLDITDDELAAFMKKQSMLVNKTTIDRYRNNLVDRASMLMNASANEMVSMPSARVQGLMFLGNDPNSWRGVGLSTLMQFQSFGAAVNYYQWGRRLANHMDINDPLFSKFFLAISGWGDTAKDMAGFVTEMAVMQYIINEMVAGVAGNRRSIHNNRGEIQADAITEKVIKAYLDQTGLASPMLDAIVTGITQPRGQGGGISLSVFPTASNVTTKVQRITNAATKKSTEGQRGKAITGAVLQDIFDFTGAPNHPFSQAAWGLIFGDKLLEWQMGTNYNNWLRQRRRRGFEPSWIQNRVNDVTELLY